MAATSDSSLFELFEKYGQGVSLDEVIEKGLLSLVAAIFTASASPFETCLCVRVLSVSKSITTFLGG